MAEKAEKKAEAAASAAPAVVAKIAAKEAKAGFLTKTPVLLGGVMVLEAVVLFAGFKFLGGKPQAAAGAELVAEDKDGQAAKGKTDKKTVEVPVLDFKAYNHTSGRNFLYDVSVFVITKSETEQRIKDKFRDNKALIEDRVRTIIAESDPEKLGGGSEPGLETLRRQVKYLLDGIVGEGAIDEVLVPRCIPFRTDY